LNHLTNLVENDDMLSIAKAPTPQGSEAVKKSRNRDLEHISCHPERSEGSQWLLCFLTITKNCRDALLPLSMTGVRIFHSFTPAS